MLGSVCLSEIKFSFSDREMPAMRNFASKWKYLSKQVERCFQLSKYCRIAFVCESFCLCIFPDVIKGRFVGEEKRDKETIPHTGGIVMQNF